MLGELSLSLNLKDHGWYSQKRTYFSPWFNPPTKYGTLSVHANIYLNDLICP